MSTLNEIRPAAKVWLERSGRPVLGHGGASILEAIREERSLSRAAKRLGMSYRYLWSYLDRMAKVVGEPVVETFRGGRAGGGGADLTQTGEYLLREYKRIEKYVSELLRDEEHLRMVRLKTIARNRLKGRIRGVEGGEVLTRVEMEIDAPAILTALISTEYAKELDIKMNDRVEALIEATEVTIEKEKLLSP